MDLLNKVLISEPNISLIILISLMLNYAKPRLIKPNDLTTAIVSIMKHVNWNVEQTINVS